MGSATNLLEVQWFVYFSHVTNLFITLIQVCCLVTSNKYMYIHVLMRDKKKGSKKQARSNKQQGKAHVWVYWPLTVLSCVLPPAICFIHVNTHTMYMYNYSHVRTCAHTQYLQCPDRTAWGLYVWMLTCRGTATNALEVTNETCMSCTFAVTSA